MSDDLVTRLRAQIWCLTHRDLRGDKISVDAVAEILRLRAIIGRWETCVMVTESLCDLTDDDGLCDICKETNND